MFRYLVFPILQIYVGSFINRYLRYLRSLKVSYRYRTWRCITAVINYFWLSTQIIILSVSYTLRCYNSSIIRSWHKLQTRKLIQVSFKRNTSPVIRRKAYMLVQCTVMSFYNDRIKHDNNFELSKRKAKSDVKIHKFRLFLEFARYADHLNTNYSCS